MARGIIETMCPRCGEQLVVQYCASVNLERIIDTTLLDTMTREQFIRSTACELEPLIHEGDSYHEWVCALKQHGVPHALACDILDYVKERKGMIRTPHDTLLYA